MKPVARIVSGALCAGLLSRAIAAVAAYHEPATQQAATAKALFRPLAAKLRRSGMPVLVPAAIPWDRLKVTAAGASHGSYFVTLSFTAGCDTGACVYGGIGGTRTASSRAGGRPVPLKLGVTGHLIVPAKCTSRCTSTLYFAYHGVAYEIDASDTDANLIEMGQHVVPIATL